MSEEEEEKTTPEAPPPPRQRNASIYELLALTKARMKQGGITSFAYRNTKIEDVEMDDLINESKRRVEQGSGRTLDGDADDGEDGDGDGDEDEDFGDSFEVCKERVSLVGEGPPPGVLTDGKSDTEGGEATKLISSANDGGVEPQEGPVVFLYLFIAFLVVLLCSAISYKLFDALISALDGEDGNVEL